MDQNWIWNWQGLDKNQWVNFMFRNSKMSRHYEAFGTSVTRIWSVVLLLFLFFQVAQGAMEAKKDAHTWDFKSLMFEKTRLLWSHSGLWCEISKKGSRCFTTIFYSRRYFEGLIEVAPRWSFHSSSFILSCIFY